MVALPQVHSAENQLVVRAQRGDMTAFEGLYRENVGRVYALCLRLEGKAERAEERTQDVFVRAWERLETFRGESAFSTWLHQLAVNVVRGEWRTEQRRRNRVEAIDTETLEDRVGEQASLDEGIDLESAIAQLPPGARRVFTLHDVEGYQHDEIAEFMGVSPGTCKAQLHRARQLLRKALER
jgi:RNA polymerase sigma-70 factor, ECF subfamily